MLTELHIRNLAVIDEVELEFGRGMTVMTGETGAGKSIMVDALALALGARADARAVRAGTQRCEISAAFSVDDGDGLDEWLRAHDLEAGSGECLIRRIVTSEGRSRGYINGQAVTMQSLQEIGDRLLDICGQQAHQSLRHRSVQRRLLDEYGGHAPLLNEVEAAYRDWNDRQAEYERLAAAGADQQARQELLGFQLRELESLNLQPGEYDELERQEKRLSHSARIEAGLRQSLDWIYDADEGAAQTQVGLALRELEQLAELDPELETARSLLSDAQIQITEAADVLRDGLQRNQHDPAREQEISQRANDARQLARKHHCAPEDLPGMPGQLATELAELEHRDDRLAELAAEVEACHKKLVELAEQLTAAREKAAGALADAVTANMQTLGMTGGRFLVSVSSLPDGRIAGYGADRIEFEVAANPGQPPGPLAKVASGGELSRISLALQVVVSADRTTGTLIFDEVDAGVGGGVAEIVGTQLCSLSAHAQVLCVTHLAQVACHADHHLRVAKVTDGQTTRTTVRTLTPDERVEEIARMLGGVKITRRTREHAREMLDSASVRRAG